MTPQQALQILDHAASLALINRADQDMVRMATMELEKLLAQQTAKTIAKKKSID